MALPSSASLTYDSITQDRTAIVIADGTTFTTPARSGLGVFFEADKMSYLSAVTQALTVVGNDNDPETDVSWTVTNEDDTTALSDGWVRGKYAAIPDYAGGTTYAIYDAAFNPTDNKVYRSLQNSNTGNSLTDSSWWEEITEPADLALNAGEDNESTNILTSIYSIEVTGLTELAFGTAIANASTEGGDAELESNVNIYELFGVLVDAEYVASDRSQFPQGERLCRRAESLATEFELV